MTSYLGGDLVQGTDYCRRAIAAFRALDDRRAVAESQATLALGAATMFTDTSVAALNLAEVVREVEQGGRDVLDDRAVDRGQLGAVKNDRAGIVGNAQNATPVAELLQSRCVWSGGVIGMPGLQKRLAR